MTTAKELTEGLSVEPKGFLQRVYLLLILLLILAIFVPMFLFFWTDYRLDALESSLEEMGLIGDEFPSGRVARWECHEEIVEEEISCPTPCKGEATHPKAGGGCGRCFVTKSVEVCEIV